MCIQLILTTLSGSAITQRGCHYSVYLIANVWKDEKINRQQLNKINSKNFLLYIYVRRDIELVLTSLNSYYFKLNFDTSLFSIFSNHGDFVKIYTFFQ